MQHSAEVAQVDDLQVEWGTNGGFVIHPELVYQGGFILYWTRFNNVVFDATPCRGLSICPERRILRWPRGGTPRSGTAGRER